MDKLNRRMKRRRRLRIIQLSIVAVIFVIIVVILINVFVVAKTIVIQNNTPYTVQELMDGIGYHIGNGLYSVSSEKATEKISQRNPYVKKVTIDYTFPSTAYISFEKSEAIFCIEDEKGTYVYLDSNLKVLQVSDELEPEHIFVSGIVVKDYAVGQVLKNDEETMDVQLLHTVFEGISSGGLSDIVTGIDLSKKYDVKFTINHLILIELGSSEDIDKKIETAKLILERNDMQKKARINVKNYQRGKYMELTEEDTSQ